MVSLAVLEEELFSKIEYLTPNETEMEILTGMPTGSELELFAAADKLLSMGVKNIVATLGKRGALIANDSGKKIIPGFFVKAVDTVAAGDSFNGALATCIVRGTDLESAVRFANAVGALTVTKQGAIPSLPYLSEVEQFFETRGI